jgi:mono/diheme cytochrome c family protein
MLLGLSALFGAACAEPSADDRADSVAVFPAEQPAVAADGEALVAEPALPAGDAANGEALVAQFECARCHDGTATEMTDAALAQAAPAAQPAPVAEHAADALDTKHCFSCHADILEGRLDHKPDAGRWKKNVAHLVAAPSLTRIGARLRYQWIAEYLTDPHDLRPNLSAGMPRLALSEAQARDIASYLSEQPGADIDADAVELDDADIARGRQRMEELECASCHRLGGAPFAKLAGAGERRETRVAVMLAPDLRHVRERWQPAALVRWIRDPLAMKPDTKMPQTPMSADDARDIAAYLLRGELQEPEPRSVPSLPPLLERRVGYDEVAERVLDKTCRHCHGDPDVALGDGGPGNTGGFGYPARKLELTSYARVNAGYVDDAGERHSVFAKMPDGTPRLVAALMARHAEEAGSPDPEVRGMPLGLPAVPLEDIQLVASWIAQGRPR